MRVPLRLLPDGVQVPILQGPIHGKRWITGSSNHGCWLGTYELQKARRLVAQVRSGMTCFDIGANVGYYTLLLSALAGHTGKVLSFEPLPANLELLRRHASINHCSNVQIFDLALSDFNGSAAFEVRDNRSTGRLSELGRLTVPCATLDRLFKDCSISKPDVIKIDVEGAEFAVISGARRILEIARPVIFLATHGPDVHASCCCFLRDMGYELEALDGRIVEDSTELLAIPR